MIKGGASPIPATSITGLSWIHPLLNISLPILGLISPPQSNRCCCLETRALRKHGKQDKLCADNFIQYVLLNSTDNFPICFTKFCRKLFVIPLMLIISVPFNDRCHLILSIQCYPTINLNFIQNYKTSKKSIHDICYSCMFRRCINGRGICTPLWFLKNIHQLAQLIASLL